MLDGIPIPLPTGKASELGSARSGRVTAVREIRQEQSNWCWAACMEMVLRGHRGDSARSQGELANMAFGQTACTIEGDNSQCNLTLSTLVVAPMWENVGFRARKSASDTITFVQIKQEISAGRAIEVGLSFGLGQGHAVLVVGWQEIGNDEKVVVLDPAKSIGGEKVIHYSELENAYHYAGRWRWTWTRIREDV